MIIMLLNLGKIIYLEINQSLLICFKVKLKVHLNVCIVAMYRINLSQLCI